jgi:predicted nucleic acid-binding Zn ribbon protein
MSYNPRNNRLRDRDAASLGDVARRFLDANASPQLQQSLHLHAAWEQAAPQAALDHTDNVVYSKRSEDTEILVYVDSSSWAAELSMQKEPLRLMMQQAMGAPVGDMKFLVSRLTSLRKRFLRSTVREEAQQEALRQDAAVPLTPEEDRQVQETVSVIAHQRLRSKLYNALKSDLEWKKAKGNKIEP